MRRAPDLTDADRTALDVALRRIEDVGIRVAAELGIDVAAERDCRGRAPALTFRAFGFAPTRGSPVEPGPDSPPA